MQPTTDPKELMKLAYTIILLSLLYFFCITFIPIPETGEDNAKYISGFLIGTGLASIIAYYFRKSGNPDPTGNPDSSQTVKTETKTTTTIPALEPGKREGE